MRKGHARILSIILMLCMIISTQSFAFAAASDGVERTLKSPVAGGFKIVDSESGDLIKNVTMELYSETGQRMGKTLCSDGQNFEMNDIEQGRTDHFTFSAANYETLTMKAQKDVIANLGVGPVWFNGGATERYIMAASVPLVKVL